MNAQRAMQKQQRDAQNAQGQEQPEQGGNGQLTDLKAQEQQLKLDFIRKKGELELQIKSAKADQDRALADSRNAAALQAQ
jgi:hypothetical protein